MIHYSPDLKEKSRDLRTHQTDMEQLLWKRLRRKQLGGYRFNRQKPLGHYIVDFYCHRARLVVEVDGGQHYLEENLSRDGERDLFLSGQGLKVLRFSNEEVKTNIEGVLETILANLNPP